MKARFEEAQRRMGLLGALITCAMATAAPAASAATFAARETHRGLLNFIYGDVVDVAPLRR